MYIYIYTTRDRKRWLDFMKCVSGTTSKIISTREVNIIDRNCSNPLKCLKWFNTVDFQVSRLSLEH